MCHAEAIHAIYQKVTTYSAVFLLHEGAQDITALFWGAVKGDNEVL
jgi:hypothetical protein